MSSPPPRFDEHAVTQRGDVQAATLALDGRHLAVITAGDELPPGMGVYLIRPGQPAERLPVPIDVKPVWSDDGDALYLLSSQPPRIDRFDVATRTVTPYVTDLGSPRAMIVGATPAGGGDLFVQLGEHTSDVYAESLAR